MLVISLYSVSQAVLAAIVEPVNAPNAAIEELLSDDRTRQVPDGLLICVVVPFNRLPDTVAMVLPLMSAALPLKAYVL